MPVVEEEVLQEAVEPAEAHLQTHLEVEAAEVQVALEEAALEAAVVDSKIETTKVAKMVMINQKHLKNQIITTVEV